jgi:hypothetical protein
MYKIFESAKYPTRKVHKLSKIVYKNLCTFVFYISSYYVDIITKAMA